MSRPVRDKHGEIVFYEDKHGNVVNRNRIIVGRRTRTTVDEFELYDEELLREEHSRIYDDRRFNIRRKEEIKPSRIIVESDNPTFTKLHFSDTGLTVRYRIESNGYLNILSDKVLTEVEKQAIYRHVREKVDLQRF